MRHPCYRCDGKGYCTTTVKETCRRCLALNPDSCPRCHGSGYEIHLIQTRCPHCDQKLKV